MADSILRRGFMLTLAGTLAGVVTVTAQQQPPRPPASTSCQPYAVMQRTYDGDYDGALALSEECAAAHLRLVNPKGLVLDSRDSGSLQSAFSAGWTVAFLCATAQLQALTGANDTAQRTVERAENFAMTWPGFKSPLISWEEPLSLLGATRGFVAERAGRVPEATMAYTRGGDAGAGRLAVMALGRGDDGNAGAFAASAREDSTALAVRGALAELRDDPYEAYYRYLESDQSMQRLLDPYPTSAALPEGAGPTRARPAGMRNPSAWDYQPMLLAERARVAKALARGVVPIQATAKPLPEVASAQRAFNSWLVSERRRLTPGVAFRPQYPRFFAGFSHRDREQIQKRKLKPPPDYDRAALLVLPAAIEVTGLLDRDTLALDFYHLGVQLLALAKRGGVAPAALLTTGRLSAHSPATQAFIGELRAARAELERLHQQLAAVSLTTNDGAVLTASDELQLKKWTADASSAHLTNLRPEAAASIEAVARRVRDRMASAERAVRAQ